MAAAFIELSNLPSEPLVGDISNNHSTTATYSNATLYYVPPGLVVLLSVIYGAVSLVAVIGNVLVILVITTNRRMHTVTNFFIANLSIADVFIGCLSIPFQFQAALLQRWDLPFILCPVASFVKELTVSVSVVTLTVIAMDRYYAVVKPLKPSFTGRTAVIVMAIVWTTSIVSSLPTAIAFRARWEIAEPGEWMNEQGLKPFCSPKYPVIGGFDIAFTYALYMTVVQYFLPLVIISGVYCRIMYCIWVARAPGSAVDARDRIINRNKKKVIKMLVIVVALFALCWLPLQVYQLLATISPSINDYQYINIIWFSSNWLAMSNSCYNPFIYGLVNEKFKQGFRLLFTRYPCCAGCFVTRSDDAADDQFASTYTYSVRMRKVSTRVSNGCPNTSRVKLGHLTHELDRLDVDV